MVFSNAEFPKNGTTEFRAGALYLPELPVPCGSSRREEQVSLQIL